MTPKKQSGSATPATRVLDRAGVRYTLHPYQHDPAAVHFGEEAAQQLGVDPATILKTLVVDTGSALAVAVVPVSAQLDLKAMAVTLSPMLGVSVKRVALADAQAATRSSGYVLGGISPVGQRTALPTVLDSSVEGQPLVMVSAGRRGLQVRLSPQDLRRVTDGRFAEIGRPAPGRW